MKLAPIVLFVYNRPVHTKITLESLINNEYAKESDLYIYSDAPKNKDSAEKVIAVREHIKQVKGFKSIKIIEQDKNLGLTTSIIKGVTEIINDYGNIIVLEDDMEVSPYFLKFMNKALEFYKNEKKVWHINAWNNPIESENLEDVFLWRVMFCWGWATWVDKWQYYEKNIDKTIKEFSKKDIYEFNVEGKKDFFTQVMQNKKNEINTWDIFWYITIFKNKGLCLNITNTLVNNIGFDGSGEHCKPKKNYILNPISNKRDFNFTNVIEENKAALNIIKKFYVKINPYSIKNIVLKLLKKISG